jgi:hypothetical protein
MGRKARERWKAQYTLERMVADHVGLYERVAEGVSTRHA